MALTDAWADIPHLYNSQGWFPGHRAEITNHPTQKPLALLHRIIRASSNAGDVVLDPFCGCATAWLRRTFRAAQSHCGSHHRQVAGRHRP